MSAGGFVCALVFPRYNTAEENTNSRGRRIPSQNWEEQASGR